MTTATTGSTVRGLVHGLSHGELHVLGNPDGIVTVTFTSGVAYDKTNDELYMALTGSSWERLGSIAL